MNPKILRDARLASGQTVDLEVRDGVVVGHHVPGEFQPNPKNGPQELKEEFLEGLLTLPALAEPHAHLDKALSAGKIKNPTGDLMGAVKAWINESQQFSHEDYVGRATSAALLALENGTTALRTHIDVSASAGLKGLDAALEVKQTLKDRIDIQVAVLGVSPLTGSSIGSSGQENQEFVRKAMAKGADLVGAAPALDPDPKSCIAFCLEVAEEMGKGVDLHMDETLNPKTLHIKELCRQVLKSDFANSVIASHCVSLGVQNPRKQKKIAAEIKNANIGVVVLPQTNLYLQARGVLKSPPRGLSALVALDEAGVLVAAGADNLQDPFNLVGRGDPLETAALLVMAGHLLPEDAFLKVSTMARTAMGLDPAGPEVGQIADLVCLDASDIREAVALAPAKRRVYKAGELVSSQ